MDDLMDEIKAVAKLPGPVTLIAANKRLSYIAWLIQQHQWFLSATQS